MKLKLTRMLNFSKFYPDLVFLIYQTDHIDYGFTCSKLSKNWKTPLPEPLF